MEPLLSNKKMYYPLALSISVSKFFPATEALYASSMPKSQNLGIKDSIAVEPTSVLPKTELGSWKSSVVKVNVKSLFGTHDLVITNSDRVFASFCETRSMS